jgi:glucose-6-phosphate 1-dehydrogenase
MSTIERLLVFGATGDLAARFLFPALAELWSANRLPPGFGVVGAAREKLSDEAFRRTISESLEEFAADVPAIARAALLQRVSYRRVALEDEKGKQAVRDLVQAGENGTDTRPVAAYLALPPRMFIPAIEALGAAGLARGSRIAVEKPFGEDAEGAANLNRLLGDVTRSLGDSGGG